MARGALLLLVFGCGLTAFELGVGVTDRAGLPEAGFLAHVYYTIGLFVLGGMDLGAPAGGSASGQALLWIAYFGAPAITSAALIEGLLYGLRPDRWRLRRLRGHTIIVGAGRLSLLYLDRLRVHHPGAPVLLVERNPEHPSLAAAREVYGALVVHGDARSNVLVDTWRLEHAARVLIGTGDDVVNLDVAAKILQRAPQLARSTVVHLSNLHLIRTIGHTRVARECVMFNSQQIAASHLVHTQLLDWFQHTRGDDTVVLAGFGRFGQTVLAQLQKLAAGKLGLVVILDVQAAALAAAFDEQIGFDGSYQRAVVDGEISDPMMWQRIESQHQLRDRAAAFVIGCGDDAVNLRTALSTSLRYPDSRIVVRQFERSSFADEVGVEAGFQTISVADLLATSMPDAWFK